MTPRAAVIVAALPATVVAVAARLDGRGPCVVVADWLTPEQQAEHAARLLAALDAPATTGGAQ